MCEAVRRLRWVWDNAGMRLRRCALGILGREDAGASRKHWHAFASDCHTVL